MAPASTIFQRANDAIIEDIKQELRLQGHHLTGALEDSIHSIITYAENSISLTASAAGYLDSLEHPTAAEDIKISEEEFQGLKKWVLLRGLASFDHEATGVAAAIVAKWKKEGRPTPGSNQYSETGKRTDAILESFQKNDVKYDGIISGGMVKELDNEFHHTKSGMI